MVYFWLLVFVLQMQCACGGGPLQDQKHWRRPVPGWRQSPESLALENQGFGFEEADFEVHFSEKGKELFQKYFQPATHEPVFRKLGDFVSSNNGGCFDKFNVWRTELYSSGSSQNSFEYLLQQN